MPLSVLPIVPNSSDQGWGLNGGGRRKRKRSGFHNAKTASPDLECNGSKEPKAFQELFAVPAPPAPKVLCRRTGNVSQRCNALTSRAWAPGRGGWMEPVGHGPALNQTQGPWPLCLVGAKDDYPSTSRPKATKRHRKGKSDHQTDKKNHFRSHQERIHFHSFVSFQPGWKSCM